MLTMEGGNQQTVSFVIIHTPKIMGGEFLANMERNINSSFNPESKLQ